MACFYVCPKEDLPSRVEIGAFESKDKVCDGLQIEHQGCESLSRSKNCSQDPSHLLCCLNTLPLHSSLAANLLLPKALSLRHGHTASMQPPAHKKIFEGTPHNAQLHTLVHTSWHHALMHMRKHASHCHRGDTAHSQWKPF